MKHILLIALFAAMHAVYAADIISDREIALDNIMVQVDEKMEADIKGMSTQAMFEKIKPIIIKSHAETVAEIKLLYGLGKRELGKKCSERYNADKRMIEVKRKKGDDRNAAIYADKVKLWDQIKDGASIDKTWALTIRLF